MDLIDKKMRELQLKKTPERQSRNGSILSTPGLPPIMDKLGTDIPESMTRVHEVFPYSPQACAYPVVVPHRIFVGGFPPGTTEHELRCYFERFGTVRDVKIIRDEDNENAAPKYTYGFVTFSTEEEAQGVVEMNKSERGRAFKFHGRYLNVNEAVKKPPNKHLKLDAPSMSLAPGAPMVCRDQNGQFLTLYPSYTVVPNPDYSVVQPQSVVMPPMFPIIVQPSMYPMPPQQQSSNVNTVPPVTYPQYGGQVPCSNPPAGYYQQQQ